MITCEDTKLILASDYVDYVFDLRFLAVCFRLATPTRSRAEKNTEKKSSDNSLLHGQGSEQSESANERESAAEQSGVLEQSKQ